MKHHSEKICIAAIILHIIFALICFGMSGWNKSAATYAAGWLLAFGAIFWLLTLIDLWSVRAAEEEEREEKEFERRRGGKDTGKIFDERGETFDAFSARTRLKRLDRWFFPILTLIAGVAMSFFSYMLLAGKIGDFDPGALTKQLPSLTFLGGIAFFSFIFSRYGAGLSRDNKNQGLRTSSGAMFSGAVCVFLIAVSFVLSNFGYPVMERIIRYIISALLGVVGIELIINFIIHLYRPRVVGQKGTPVYYSRILGLIAVPRSIFRATAITLDYQFGFKISETWFYQFFERAAVPLVFYLLLILYLFTCIVVVQSNEEVIVERFGRPLEPPLGPGIHLKLPFPFDKAYRFQKSQIKEMTIGVRPKQDPGKILIWTQMHHEEEYNFIVAQKDKIKRTDEDGASEVDPAVAVNFIALNISLQYRIKNTFDYAYNKSNPEKMLEDLAYREIAKYCATVDYIKFLGEGRGDAEKTMQDNMVKAIESESLGIQLLSLNLIDVHPPVPTVAEFEAVVGAEQEKEAKIYDAQGFATDLLNVVAGTSRQALINAVRKYDETVKAHEEAILSGDVEKIKAAEEAVKSSEATVERYLLLAGGTVSQEIQQADSERYRLVTLTKAESESFAIQSEAYKKNPEIYKLRYRLQALIESVADARKYIIPAGTENTEVFIINLEEKAPSILDVPLQGKQ